MGNFCKVLAGYKQVRDSAAFLYQIAGILFLLSTAINIWYLSKVSALTVSKTLVVLSNGICLTLRQYNIIEYQPNTVDLSLRYFFFVFFVVKNDHVIFFNGRISFFLRSNPVPTPYRYRNLATERKSDNHTAPE